MNVRRTNAHRMLTTTQAVFVSNKDAKTWTSIPALVTAVGDLDIVTSAIAGHFEVLAGPSGASASKATLLASLTGLAYEVASGLHACAVDAGNDELAGQVDLSATDLSKGRETNLVAKCARVLSLATENLKDLGEYNITQAKLTALGKKLEAFQKAAPKPRQDVARRGASNKALPVLFRRARGILVNRIDRLMVQFKTTAPDFYHEYRMARKLVNHPGGQSRNAAVATPVPMPAAQAA
jgi:hypothetical protein